MKRLAFILLLALPAMLPAQELNCMVSVVSPQIQGTTEKRIFDNLQKSLYEFMNNTKWTNDVFSPEERINCQLQMNVTKKLSADEYEATLQVISTRTIYKTSLNSTVLNHNDADLSFKYVEFQPMEFSISQHLNNLTSIMAYYAYVILATDYDSFSEKGGTPYWQKAQTIVANAQAAPEKGWKSMENNKNRFWLVDNMLQPTYAPVRLCMYKYHRLGMDVMYQDVMGGRAQIFEALQTLESVHNQRPLSFPLQMFFNAKYQEIVDIFKGGLPEEKSKIVPLLQKIDPGHGLTYQKINQEQ